MIYGKVETVLPYYISAGTLQRELGDYKSSYWQLAEVSVDELEMWYFVLELICP